jgi:hypothetical protein
MTVTLAHLIYTASALPSSASDLRSAISSLEKAIAPLEDSSGCWEKALPWFTGLVVVGLIVEIFALVWERRDGMAAWRDWVAIGINPAERPSNGRFVLEVVASIAIFLGVALELFAGAEIAYLNGQLRSKNGDLRSKSDQLIALLTQETEDDSLARVKLEATVAWRRLSKRQLSALSDNLKPPAGLKVGVSYLNGEAEGLGFANDIATALRAAKWNVFSPREPFTQFGGFGGGIIPLESLTGVNVSNTGNRLGRDAADAIQHELCSLGFDTTITRKPQAFGPRDPKIDVEVLVVGRPATTQGLTQLSIDTKTAMKTCRASD